MSAQWSKSIFSFNFVMISNLNLCERLKGKTPNYFLLSKHAMIRNYNYKAYIRTFNVCLAVKKIFVIQFQDLRTLFSKMKHPLFRSDFSNCFVFNVRHVRLTFTKIVLFFSFFLEMPSNSKLSVFTFCLDLEFDFKHTLLSFNFFNCS